jgi:hypothetical protein
MSCHDARRNTRPTRQPEMPRDDTGGSDEMEDAAESLRQTEIEAVRHSERRRKMRNRRANDSDDGPVRSVGT